MAGERTPAEERLYAFADAVTRRDPDTAIAQCHPEVEFYSALASVEGQAFEGHDGIRRYFEDVVSAWDEWRVELHHVEEVPDGRLAVTMTMHVRGLHSGAEVAQEIGHVWELRDGLLWRCTAFPTGEMALAEAGVK
ncbi:MAG TPA: nuclear transport factor 2 family protein [Thermoleophilaceae bacterium]|nr:nuclear transport factor 2 family protein [Thermoleophilaceae bacterium]